MKDINSFKFDTLTLSVFFLVSVSCLILAPLLLLLMLTIYLFFFSNSSNPTLKSFIPALYIAVLVSLINFNGHIVGDINRYYAAFEIGSSVNDFTKSLVRYKFLQWYLFHIINELGISIRVYALIGVFISVFPILYTFNIIIKNRKGDKSIVKNFFTFILIITLLPFDIIYNFEYASSVAVFFFSLVIFEKLKFKLLIGLMCAVAIHNGIALLVLVYCMLVLFKKNTYGATIFVYLVFLALFLYGSLEDASNFIGYSSFKFYAYYSKFKFDISILLVSTIYILAFSYILWSRGGSKITEGSSEETLFNIMKVLVLISPLLLFNSVFSQRFIIFIAPFFLCFFYYSFIVGKYTLGKLLLFFLIFLSNFSYGNALIINSFISYVHVAEYSGSFLITSLSEVFSYYK